MKKSGELEIYLHREEARLNFNTALLGITFAVFTLVATISPEIFRDNGFLTLQIVLAIPLFVASILARSKSLATPGRDAWDKLSFINFIIAYSFLINAIGIILAVLVSHVAVFTFFGINVLSSIIYSTVQVTQDNYPIKKALLKDAAFIILIIFLGLLPGLGMY
jgi:hypothetical protein